MDDDFLPPVNNASKIEDEPQNIENEVIDEMSEEVSEQPTTLKIKPQQEIFIGDDVKKPKQKRKLSEKQIAHLERIRVKSLEAKAEKRKEKEALMKEKEDALVEKNMKKQIEMDNKREAEILKKVRQQVLEEQTRPSAPINIPQPIPQPVQQPVLHPQNTFIDYDRIDGLIDKRIRSGFEEYEKKNDAKKAILIEQMKKDEEQKKKRVQFNSMLNPNRFNSFI
tara:strand:+ start:1620 stop:2288 length:669 start_codon:yes stop_codon:yes gene_type:complete